MADRDQGRGAFAYEIARPTDSPQNIRFCQSPPHAMASTPQSVLQKAAEDGSLDPVEWPQTLSYILNRLDEIIDLFPKPTQPSSTARPQPTISSQDSATGDKENAAPTTPTRPPVPAFATQELGQWPPETINMYSSIRTALSKNFAKDAPHTIQRLAELILEPQRRYKFLPPYLRALDRVISVSSPNALFPLPQPTLPIATGMLNGITSVSSPSSVLGSDESLGGALLTPIPWLQSRGAQNELVSESTEMVDGPNGAGRIETVTVAMLNAGNSNTPTATSPTTSPTSATQGGGDAANSQIASSHPDGESLPSMGAVTQGEILRQEQEAGVVLNNPHTLTSHPSRTVIGEAAVEGSSGPANANVMETIEGEEEAPHARGPEVIGMEDTGPQPTSGALDIEGAIGRPSIERASKSPGPTSEPKDEATDIEKDKDEDMKDGSSSDGGAAKAEDDAKPDQDTEMKTDE
ncbi:unnamed protein product [Periconia digitata]|uniref:Protein phosphatase 4 core regulatory subunit R2 n=1 Tax=Periconia digitata TaxID=1303443 RepID=A0A9W4U3J4_9PLEO|nr:unnamed protein product [Periconia digitata]